MRCPHCGRQAPPGAYCGYCGARLPHAEGEQAPHSAQRRHAFAAEPRESLFNPAIISTLFPHLPPRRAIIARWLLGGGALVLLGIALGRFVPVALVLGAALLPALYLAYFYDAEVYEDQPVSVLAGTFVAGAALGAALSLVFYRVLIAQRPLGAHSGPSGSYIALNALVIPLLAQALMLVGPLVLYFTRRNFDDILDGLVFGAASGLGFAAAQSVVYAWLLVTGPFQRNGGAFEWMLPTLHVAILSPLLDAAATGLICAALWLRRDPHVRQRPKTLATSLTFAVIAAIVGQVAPSLLTDLVRGQILSFVWYLLAAFTLLMLARVGLHLGLLEKGAEAVEGDENTRLIVCPTCERMTSDLTFCSECGVALRASSKRAARHARQSQQTPGQAAEGGQQ